MTPYYSDDLATIYHGDCRELLPEIEPVDMIFTSPPYNLGTTTGGGFPGYAKAMGHCEIAAKRCAQETLGLTA